MINNREEKKKQTRNKILIAATELYSEKGFVQTSVDEISQRAGVAKGTIFLHYQNQDVLMEAVIAQLKQEFSEKIDRVDLQDIETVAAFLSLHLEILSEHEALYRNFISQRRLLGEKVNACYLGIQSIFSHHLGLLLKEDAKIPLNILFNTWLGLIHYYLNNDDLFGKEDIISKYQDQWIDIFLKMIK